MLLEKFASSAEELEKARRVLDLLFAEYVKVDGPVNGQDFRADHFELVPVLDRLYNTPFVRQDSHGNYLPGLASLWEVAAPEASSLRADIETILANLHEQYRDKTRRRDPRKLPQLAVDLAMPLKRLFACLEFMQHDSWFWAGGSRIDRTNPDESFVQPGERILQYRSLNDVVKTLENQIGIGASNLMPMTTGKASTRLLRTSLDSYTLGEKIGEGGCSFVYEATVASDNSTVAVKILKSEAASTQRLKRFQNELMFCMANKHDHIVQVVDHGITENSETGVPFFVMPRFDGTLRDLIKDGVVRDHALPLFMQIIAGLAAAHSRGVIHRDLKPENILWDGKVKKLLVADFGIAHFAQEDLYTSVETRAAERLANHRYAAPEQRERGIEIGSTADIYALGLILNELYTGTVPVGTAFTTIAQVAGEFAWLDDLVDRMIRQQAGQRIQSLEALRREIELRASQHASDHKLRDLASQSTASRTGVPDDLVADPICVAGFDYEKEGTLVLKLNKVPPPGWVEAFDGIGNFESFYGGLGGPGSYRFSGAEARIKIEPRNAQQVTNWFKDLLPKAAQEYESRRRASQQKKEEQERKKLEQELEQERQRLDMLKNLRI